MVFGEKSHNTNLSNFAIIFKVDTKISVNSLMANKKSEITNWWLVRATYVVDGRFFGHFFWKVVGSYAHTHESRTATVHGAPYTVNSRVVVGAIYAYMCTYSYRTRCTVHGVLTCGGGGNIRIHVYLQLLYTVHCTRCTHVWWWGQYTHTCVPTATVHGVPYTVNSRVVVGAIYAYMCTYSYRTRCTVHSELTVCGGAIYAYMCTYSYRTWCTIHGAPYTVHCTR